MRANVQMRKMEENDNGVLHFILIYRGSYKSEMGAISKKQTMANVCKAQDALRCTICFTSGEFRCHSCSIILCETCVGKHMSSIVSKPHDLTSLFFKKSQLKLPTCSFHEDENCELFCQTCNSAVCTKCIASGNHKTHDLKEVLKYLMERKSSIEKAKKDVGDSIVPMFKKMKDQVEEKLKILDTEFDSIEENIYKNKDRWQRLLDSIVDNTIQDARKMRSCIQKDLMSKQDSLQIMVERSNEHLQSMTEVLESVDALKVINYHFDIQCLLQNAVKIQIKSPIFSGKIFPGEELKRNFGEISSPVETTLEWPQTGKDKKHCMRSKHFPAVRRKDLTRYRTKSFSDSEEDVVSSMTGWNQSESEQGCLSGRSSRRCGIYETPARGGAQMEFLQRLSDSNLYQRFHKDSMKKNRFSASGLRAFTLPAGRIRYIIPRSPSMICIDDVVEFARNNGFRCSGIVKYVGNLKDLEGIFVGVELDAEEDGKHDGTFHGVRYFKCKPLKGLFVKFEKVFNILKTPVTWE